MSLDDKIKKANVQMLAISVNNSEKRSNNSIPFVSILINLMPLSSRIFITITTSSNRWAKIRTADLLVIIKLLNIIITPHNAEIINTLMLLIADMGYVNSP